MKSHLNLLPSENDKVLGPPHHEPGELVGQQLLYLVRLLDGDRDPDGVDGGLDEDPLLLVPGDDDGVEQHLRRLLHLDLGLVVALHLLRGEVLQAHGRLQRALHRKQVRLQGGRLENEGGDVSSVIKLEQNHRRYALAGTSLYF